VVWFGIAILSRRAKIWSRHLDRFSTLKGD